MSDILLDKSIERTSELKSNDLLDDEREVLNAYRRAKRMIFADLAITIQEGKRVKLWLTEKIR